MFAVEVIGEFATWLCVQAAVDPMGLGMKMIIVSMLMLLCGSLLFWSGGQ